MISVSSNLPAFFRISTSRPTPESIREIDS
jgi:hypothetical protein